MQLALRPLPRWLEQAARFGAVGLLNTALDLGLYTLLTRSLPLLASAPVLVKGFSYAVGVLNSFFLNRAWTFHSAVGIRSALPRFVLVNLVGLVLNTTVLNLALNLAHFPEFVALALATLASLAWNFTASKRVVFR
jgi:putative flippase GtrA